MNYNFKKFFDTGYKIADEEYVCNGHFLIKRNCLKKSQNNFVSTFSLDNDRMKFIKNTYIKAQETADNTDAIEFIPMFVGKEKDNKTGNEFNIVLTENNKAIQEQYYNFFKNLKCRIFYYPNQYTVFTPLPIYKDNFELVGIVLPVNPKDSINNKEVINK